MFSDLRVQLPQSEQINEPSNPTHYWRYRMHVKIDDLSQHAGVLNTLSALARESKRMK